MIPMVWLCGERADDLGDVAQRSAVVHSVVSRYYLSVPDSE